MLRTCLPLACPQRLDPENSDGKDQRAFSDFHPTGIPENGKLVDGIAWIARAQRKAGLPVGPGGVIEAIRAIEAAGAGTERKVLKNEFFGEECLIVRALLQAMDPNVVEPPALLIEGLLRNSSRTHRGENYGLNTSIYG